MQNRLTTYPHNMPEIRSLLTHIREESSAAGRQGRTSRDIRSSKPHLAHTLPYPGATAYPSSFQASRVTPPILTENETQFNPDRGIPVPSSERGQQLCREGTARLAHSSPSSSSGRTGASGAHTSAAAKVPVANYGRCRPCPKSPSEG